MSNIVPFTSPAKFTVPRSSKVRTFSEGRYSVIQKAATFDRVLFEGIGIYTSDAFTVDTVIEVSGGTQLPVLYSVGTSPIIPALTLLIQRDPATFDTAGTLAPSDIFTRIIVSNNAGPITVDVPAGADLDAASTFAVNDFVDWKFLNAGAGTITLAPSAGHTIVGGLTTAAGNTSRYRTRKTAADTFVSYRI